MHTQGLLTDNGGCYRSEALATVVAQHRIVHRFTRPYRPQTNGKAERFIRTQLHEWAYAQAYRDSRWRTAALTRYPRQARGCADASRSNMASHCSSVVIHCAYVFATVSTALPSCCATS